MIAIAESGSTKCEWLIINQSGQITSRLKTQGFNPDFHDADFVKKTLNANSEFDGLKHKVDQLYFYGAGCSSATLNANIKCGLSSVFKNAVIVVDHDLLASAFSLYNDKPLVCCILGTGSNSAYFDGNKLKESVPALGFILGDEGGGGYFGKKLLADYFYGKLPKNLAQDFSETYQLTWNEARSKIYGDIHANVYLASFMPFLSKHKDSPYVIQLIKQGFAHFIDIHVACFPEAKSSEVSFVGTIAFIFKDILSQELNKAGYSLGKIIKSPANELLEYHIKYKSILKSLGHVDAVEINSRQIKKG